MDKLRIGMERIWKGTVDLLYVLRDNLQDLVALVAIGGDRAGQPRAYRRADQATTWLLDLLGPADQPATGR